MFSKKLSVDVKKSTQKFLDGKRDIPTRFRHLKIVLENVDSLEAKCLLESYYSPVFHIFHDTYTATESTLKQKSHKVQREELDAVLILLEKILLLLPELLQQRWQKHTLTRLFKRLLHPANNSKLRKDAMRLFIMWYQILGEQADAVIHSMFASLVPGFSNNIVHSFPHSTLNLATAMELLPLIPPQAGEKGVEDPPRFYLDSLMELMITQVMRIEWRDKHLGRPQKCFSFLLQRFQTCYLPHIFPEISYRTNLYRPDLSISDLHRLGPQDSSSNAKQPFVTCRVVVLKWLAHLTHVPQSTHGLEAHFSPPGHQPLHLGSPAMESSFYSQISEKEAPSYISEQHRSEVAVVQDVLFGNRENVNLVIELYRQAFLLPLHHSPSIRRILSLYRDWIHRKVEIPIFMREPIDESAPRMSVSIPREQTSVYAGMQNVFQVFITHAANVFMSWVPPGSPVLLEEQVDICKRVLNIYRYMVMNSPMEQKTWEQLLLVLLQATMQVLGDKVPDKKDDTLGNRLAPALFQTLIVTWIRANLNVVITVELWDQFVQTLSSLTVWEELIREWAKTMDILTRVLAKNLYHLDLSDLPLDRLSEQKAKKRRAGRIETSSGLASLAANQVTPKASHQQPTASTPVSTPVASPPAPAAHHEAPGPDETRSIGGSIRSRHSVVMQGHQAAQARLRHCSSGETSLRTADSWILHRSKRIERCRSEGSVSRKSRKHRAKRYGRYDPVVPSIPTMIENKLNRMFAIDTPSTAQLLRRPLVVRRNFLRKRSRSMDSIRLYKITGIEFGGHESDSEDDSRSPSPSSGVESNSFKDSPMQMDVMALDQGFDSVDGDSSHTRSVMFGGKAKGWLPDVAVVMWRRMLGSLGDPNQVRHPHIHAAIFDYLVELGSVLVKIRQNQGVSLDNMSTPPPPQYVPPILMLVPWCQKALTLPSAYQRGKLLALRLLCSLIVRPQDVPLPRNQLLLFFRVLHTTLSSQDLDSINIVIKYTGARFFSLLLPGYNLLMLDYLQGANSVLASSDTKGSSRMEAISILGSLLVIPDRLPSMPVLKPIPHEYGTVLCSDIKDHLVSSVFKAAKREMTSVGRCVAISSLALYVYAQLSHGIRHAKVKEGISVLLAVLKQCITAAQNKSSSNSEFKNRMVGQVACDMLLLLCDHAEYLLEYYPEVPKIIVEDLSNTFHALSSNPNCNDQTKRLLHSLAICLGEWCMKIPLDVHLEAQQDSPPLLENVFRVLRAVSSGSHHRETFPARPLDPEHQDPPVDNVNESSTTLSPPQSPMSSPVKESRPGGEGEVNAKSIRLAARMLADHLINHLGHFPVGHGPARLSSMVSEHDDLPGFQGEEMTSELFQSPHVQFFMLNKDTLMSMVELPAMADVPGSPTSHLLTAPSVVRIILRNLSGKFCWDTALVYGRREDFEARELEVKPVPPPIPPRYREEQSMMMSSSFIGLEGELHQASRFSIRQRPPHVFPTYENTSEDMDNLEDLLRYIGHSSPECIPADQPNGNLAGPGPRPPGLSAEIEEEALNGLLQQKHAEMEYYSKHKNEPWMKAQPAEEPKTQTSFPPFHFCKMLFSQLGLTSWDKRGQVHLLKKSEKLIRELKNLDNQKCRETHKIAIIYVGPGQEDKQSILSNTGGSQAFEDFIAGLAWEVELETHTGFLGGLQRNRSTGETAPYFATSFTEVIFHVSTRMPSHNQDAILQKMRHLGNDEVHIVWSEHSRDYRRGIIPTEFCDVLIIIYPLANGLFRVQMSRKPDVPFVGPLFNECIVDRRVLPGLVRATALNASRATRSTIPYYHTFYEERSKALETITSTLVDYTTFEEFCASLFCPSVSLPLPSSSASFTVGSAETSSGPPSGSGHVTFSSETSSFNLPGSLFRHSSTQDARKATEAGSSASSSTVDVDEPHYASPKAHKRLSFKQTTRKVSAFSSQGD